MAEVGGQKFQVSEKDLFKLPSEARAYSFVKRLGITNQTLWRWINREAMPVMRRYDGAVIVKLDQFRAWAKKTGRYK